jgi:hypothetical protein
LNHCGPAACRIESGLHFPTPTGRSGKAVLVYNCLIFQLDDSEDDSMRDKEGTAFFLANCIGALLQGALIYGLRTTGLLRNYLPDMLWAYALVFALCFLIGQKEAEVFKIFITAAVFSTVLELLQITSYVRGTFDFFDILAEILAEALAVFVIRMKMTRKWRAYEENDKNSGSGSLPFPVRRHGTGKRRILK